MGEEQDKFALAVIIFKLLNNGIHPFSGVPRKADSEMLTIQNRIEKYHYAYGLWPDAYQAPHPYSLHEYFDKETLELFERAFTKGGDRPSAYEWQEHLWKLMHSLKQCKKTIITFISPPKAAACALPKKNSIMICTTSRNKRKPRKKYAA